MSNKLAPTQDIVAAIQYADNIGGIDIRAIGSWRSLHIGAGGVGEADCHHCGCLRGGSAVVGGIEARSRGAVGEVGAGARGGGDVDG